MEIRKTLDYDLWFQSLAVRTQLQITARLERIQHAGHFGDSKNLGEQLFELRWKNGYRIYFCRQENIIILLLGGSKHEQQKDIKKARNMLR